MHLLLQIQLLGGFSLFYGESLIHSIHTARLQSLIALLALHANIPQNRRHLAFVLWPDTTESHARNNLRQFLHQLHRLLPDSNRFLSIDANTICWQLDQAQKIDVQCFEQTLAEAEAAERRGDSNAAERCLVEALSYYKGDLLPSCYDDWITSYRERLRQDCHRATQKLVFLLEKRRDFHAALQAAQSLLQLDPLDETTTGTLMRLHELNHDKEAARRAYQITAERLRRELGVEPGENLQQAYLRVLRVPQTQSLERTASPLLLVGRQPEWQALQAAWQLATQNNPCMVLITGEAGIGKSRLAEELFNWASQQGYSVAYTRSYSEEGRLSLAPVTEWLRSPALRHNLGLLDKVWLTEIARLLPELLSEDKHLPHPEPIGEYGQRQSFFEALARAVLFAPPPLLLWIDDLQWCDPETFEWLHFLLRFRPRSALLVLGTARCEESPPEHPLVRLTRQLRADDRLTSIELAPLDATETARLASQIEGYELDIGATLGLFRQTEGNPLFVIEMVRAGIDNLVSAEAPVLADANHSLDELPPRVYAVIAGRLAQLSPIARQVVETGAAIGRAFAIDLLLQVGQGRETDTFRALDELWQKRVVREQSPNVFDFTHDKLREVAYAETSPPQRRLLHRRIAQALESLHADELDIVSGQIAAQYEQAGLFEQALPYYQSAGAMAASVYANDDAIELFLHGLSLLSKLPSKAKRDAHELVIQLSLARLYRLSKGWASPEVELTMRRCMVLSEKVGDANQQLHTMFGMQSLYVVQARFEKVEQTYSQTEKLYNQIHKASQPPFAEIMLAGTKLSMGQLVVARELFEKAIAVREDKHVHDLQESLGLNYLVHGHAWNAHTLWCLGYPQQALFSARSAIEFAREFIQPFNQALAITYQALLLEWCSDARTFQAHAEHAVKLANEFKAPYYFAWASILYRFALAWEHPGEENLSQLREAIQVFTTNGARIRLPIYYSLLARACVRAGQIEQSLEAIELGFAESLQNDEHWWDAELHRLHGELMAAQGAEAEEIEAAYLRGIEVAQSQRAKSLELRSAISLARLWRSIGRTGPAKRLLQPLYNWFTQGQDTPDLRAAESLISQL
jgi:DNA-binding SARP family transcriptional activator